MTTASLREKPVRDLARLAKQHGVSGWHSMRKDQLIRALVKKAKSRSAAPAATLRPSAVAGSKTASRRGPGTTKQADRKGLTKAERDAVVARRLRDAREKLAKAKNLSTGPESGKPGRRHRDRVVLMVRGPHWLHAFWEVTPRSIARAEAALGQEWHSAKPVLRMLQIESGSQASPAERPVRDIPIHGGVKNWFIDIRDRITCRVEIGYKTSSGRFHALGRSNVVSTPAASQGDTLDVHWGEIADDCEKIYALSGGFSSENNSTELQELFEERLKRRLGPRRNTRTSTTSGRRCRMTAPSGCVWRCPIAGRCSRSLRAPPTASGNRQSCSPWSGTRRSWSPATATQATSEARLHAGGMLPPAFAYTS